MRNRYGQMYTGLNIEVGPTEEEVEDLLTLVELQTGFVRPGELKLTHLHRGMAEVISLFVKDGGDGEAIWLKDVLEPLVALKVLASRARLSGSIVQAMQHEANLERMAQIMKDLIRNREDFALWRQIEQLAEEAMKEVSDG